jgi:hypothetical protein
MSERDWIAAEMVRRLGAPLSQMVREFRDAEATAAWGRRLAELVDERLDAMIAAGIDVAEMEDLSIKLRGTKPYEPAKPK